MKPKPGSATIAQAGADLAIVQSTVRVVLRCLLAVLFLEVVLSVGQHALDLPPSLWSAVVKDILLLALLLPILFWLVLRPVAELAARQAATAAEARFEAIAQAAGDAIVILDVDWKIHFANRATEKMLGIPVRGWEKTPFETVLPEDTKQFLQAARARYREAGERVLSGMGTIELGLLRSDGSRFPAEVRVSEFREGQQTLFVAMLRDITARKNAEREIQERTTRLNALLANSPLAIVVLDESHRVQMCNPAFEELFGYHAAEIAGSELDALVASDALRAEAGGITSHVMAGETTHMITRRQRKDGSPVDVEIYGVPLVIDGKQMGAYAIYQNLTERRKLEDAAKKLESRYRDLFEQANDAILIVRQSDEVILDANPKAFEVYGWRREELLGMSLKRISRDVARDAQQIARLQSKGRGWNFEAAHFRKNGQPVNLLCSGSLVDYEGEPAVMAVLHDVTEQKKAEDALRASEREFREVIERLPVGVRIAHQRKVIFANAADARMHGFASPAELVGQDSLQQIVPEDRDRAIAKVRELEEGGSTPVYYQLRRIRRDQTEFPAALSVVSIHFAGLPALLVAIEDLSDRNRLSLFEQLLPVCCVCGKIRDDQGVAPGQGTWDRLDRYISKHTDAKLSHTFCPPCLEEYRKREGLA